MEITPAYLVDPPDVIDIDLGRQLFVDDFLIEESSLYRTFHKASYHPASPLLTPVGARERRDPHAELTGTPQSPAAMVFSDGVFFDPADRVYKMWYMAGYQQHTALALSRDGVQWERPALDVVPGTNIVSTEARDSSAVWLDLDARDAESRYKRATYEMDARAIALSVSRDGVHWQRLGIAGRGGDRSTAFYNAFRGVWVFSLRNDTEGLHRLRRYLESRNFRATRWQPDDPVLWAAADRLDAVRPDTGATAQLYNLDAVAYESLLLGLFTIFRGERPDREKPNELCLGFSRDGFHWHRPSRAPFIGVSERQGDWNWANVQSAGGCCLIVGDQLYFYVSGRAGVPGTDAPGVSSTGLATLRRDGFASVSDVWPPGMARTVEGPATSLITRPVRFSGGHFFVNADIEGELRVELLDRAGKVIAPFTADRSVPLTGDHTRARVTWRDRPSIASLAGEPVRIRFVLTRARLYAFWVSASDRGASGGYVAAGGPGFTSARDTI